MKRIANQLLASELQGESHVPDRLERELQTGDIYELTLDDVHAVYSLIFPETTDTQVLIPDGQPRTLREIASRFIRDWQSFEKLAAKHPWFHPCVEIDASFDYRKLGRMCVVSADDHERQQSPAGAFYIYEGAHRLLVLAVNLMNEVSGFEFQPITVLLLLPRRR